MTEDEAKTKACCAGLGIGPHKESWMPSGAACIGSACMAWRWDVTPEFYEQMAYDPSSRIREAGGPTGFCGLAGRP